MIAPTSRIEISRSALRHNLDFIRDLIGPDVLLSSVVKGNAYGHGIEEFVPMAEACGVRHFSVFSAAEAYRVHAVAQSDPTIMIMGMIDNAQLEWAISVGIEFFVFDLDRLRAASEIARKVGKPVFVHLEIETGMHRTGFKTSGLPGVVEIMHANPELLKLRGLCTHFAGAESIANYYRIKKQQRKYQSVSARLLREHLRPDLRHTACSAATLRYPRTRLDLVRIGILQYGFFPSREVLVDFLGKHGMRDYPLMRCISWKSQVMDVKSVKTGEFIGYGTSYLANADTVVAIVPVGYSNGFSRALSNQGRVLIHGQRVSVVGMVNMNMISVDVTTIENVQKGDEVVIIGEQGDLEMSVSAFSEFSTQVNYELLTRLPVDIPREVTE